MTEPLEEPLLANEPVNWKENLLAKVDNKTFHGLKGQRVRAWKSEYLKGSYKK